MISVLSKTQNWINARCRPEDVALEIRSAPLIEASRRGAAVFYIGKNEARCSQAELLLLALLRRVTSTAQSGGGAPIPKLPQEA